MYTINLVKLNISRTFEITAIDRQNVSGTVMSTYPKRVVWRVTVACSFCMGWRGRSFFSFSATYLSMINAHIIATQMFVLDTKRFSPLSLFLPFQHGRHWAARVAGEDAFAASTTLNYDFLPKAWRKIALPIPKWFIGAWWQKQVTADFRKKIAHCLPSYFSSYYAPLHLACCIVTFLSFAFSNSTYLQEKMQVWRNPSLGNSVWPDICATTKAMPS